MAPTRSVESRVRREVERTRVEWVEEEQGCGHSLVLHLHPLHRSTDTAETGADAK